MIDFNIYAENEYSAWDIDVDKYSQIAKKIMEYYMSCAEIAQNCCLKDFEYNKISFDFLFCNSNKTHEINRDYRQKDYPADIITFAVFADSPKEEKFVLDLEINLGEIIIGLDKIIDNAQQKDISKETELVFMISHGLLHLLGFDHQTQEEFDFVVKYQKQALKSMEIDYDKI